MEDTRSAWPRPFSSQYALSIKEWERTEAASHIRITVSVSSSLNARIIFPPCARTGQRAPESPPFPICGRRGVVVLCSIIRRLRICFPLQPYRTPYALLSSFLELSGQSCLVVGAGAVGCRKIASLLECPIERLHVIDLAEPDTNLQVLLEDKRVSFTKRPFTPSDVEGAPWFCRHQQQGDQ